MTKSDYEFKQYLCESVYYAHYNNILKFLKYWEITEFMPVEMFDEEANILYNGIRLALRNRKIKNILHD